MRYDVTSNGYTKRNLNLEEFLSVISVVEHKKILALQAGQTYERKPFGGMSGTYEFKVTRVL